MIAEPDRTNDVVQQLLHDPETAQHLADLLRRLPDLNAMLDVLRGFIASGSRLAENAGDIVQTARAAAGEGGTGRLEDLMNAAGTGTRVLEELAGPLGDEATIESLRSLLEMVPKLVAAAEILDQFLAGSTRFAENLNDIVVTARKAAEKSWPDLGDRQGLLDLPGELLSVVESPSLRRLLTSHVLSDDALDVMDKVADATIEAHDTALRTDARVGRIGAFKALGDPDVQRGMALAIEVARSLGVRLREDGAAGSAGAATGHGVTSGA